ncbi:MAG: M1 family metallopeptidase [Terracidiphilus sp.]|jgi:aminopeptidase N/puromycin-sensitive aminopeptidase
MYHRSLASRYLAALASAAALACLVLASVRSATAQRLPSTVLPEHYTLTLTPDLKAATFSGVESIDVTIAEPAGAITLNAAEIAFQSVSVTANGKQQTASVTLNNSKEQATFTFPEKLAAGKATLSIAYTGILNNQLRGFYLSKTARRNYAVTQFEPTDARRAFPSFDEPAFKATYDVSLVVDSADTAISNSPIEADTPGPGAGKHTLKFSTTPKMSTYLVAFLVGDFQCTGGESDGVAIRVCATPDKVALTPYGVDVAKWVLHYYDNYFGIHYPLKKLDLIALPDFEAGAMENFGAITYRETLLLIDPKTASVGAKKEVAIVIAHEMAHQWFGDLVTMQWWDNLWLNEGFATWMENKSVAIMHPEWNIDQGVANDEDSTLNLDAQPTTRSIRAKAETPDEINQMFDGIAYGKAGDVLLTVENYLGPETFRKGVHAYLTAHEYANATAEDFWNAQTATSHKPVDKIMESLVAQPGEPLLTFGEPAKGQVSVAQKRFFLSPGIQPDPAQKWTLPVCFEKGDESQKCEVLTPAASMLPVPKTGLFFANAGGKGYYRSAYPPSVYANLVANVETSLTPTERISLIGDEWAQLRANKAKVGDYMNLVAAVKADPNANVLGGAIGGVDAIYERVAATPEEKAAVSAWIRRTLAPDLANLGPPSESDPPNTRELRAELFGILGFYGKDPAVLAQANSIVEKYLADPASVDATLGQTALAVAARNGDAALFDKLQTLAETSTNPERQNRALRLLAQFEDPALAQRSLDYAVSGKVRNQDAAIQIAYALQIDGTRDLAWKYIQANWDKVQAQLTTEMGGVLVNSAGSFCSAASRDDVKQFFSTHKVAASDLALKHAIEHIDGCIEFRTLQEPNLKQWLETQPKP